MKGQSVVQKRSLLLLFVVGVSVLMGCSAETLQVGIEPTATLPPTTASSPTATPPTTPAPSPTPTPGREIYRSETHGFTFSYPSTWSLVEEPNVVKLSQGTLTLRVGYRWTTELVNIDGGRTGAPAGDLIYGDKVSFFDLVIPAQVLEFEQKDKAVFYGEAGHLIETGDLIFGIWLDDPHGTDYAELDIAKEIQAEATAILESFTRIEAITQPPSPSSTPAAEESLATYIDDTYNLTFQYPADWVIQEQGTRFVRLGQEPLSLYIGYMWLFESVNIWNRSGVPAGELESRGTVTFLGQELSRDVLVDGGKDLVVFYGSADWFFQADDLAFAIYLDDLSPSGSADIPVEFQAAADQVVESLTLLPEEPPVTDLAIVGWYGSVHGLPATARFDDYLSLLPEGAGAVGLAGASPAVEAEIEVLRNKDEPGKFAHFWGSLTCGVSDYGGCQLLVTHLRPDGPGPLLDPDRVEAWDGTVVTDSAWAQIDDAFILSGDYPVHYGIWGEDPMLAAQIEGVRNSGLTIRIWGQLTCGVMDANGCQIQVNQLDIERDSEGQIPAQATEIKYVMALVDVTMHSGPSEEYPVIGGIFEGMAALVTGISADGQWWQVICPDDRVGSCWVSAAPEMTAPTQPPSHDPDTWGDYTNLDYGFSFQYPGDWTIVVLAEETLGGGQKWPAVVELSRGTLVISIQYLHMSDMAAEEVGLRSLVDPQEITIRENTLVMGQEADRYVWAHEGVIKAVGISCPAATADLLLHITLSERVVEGMLDLSEAESIPESALAAFDQILNSLALIQ